MAANPQSPKQTLASADAFAQARPLQITERFSNEFDANVCFRELTAEGIDMFLTLSKNKTFTKQEIIGLLQRTICSPGGELLFGDDAGGKKLERLHWDGVQELFQLAVECLGLTKENIAKKKRS